MSWVTPLRGLLQVQQGSAGWRLGSVESSARKTFRDYIWWYRYEWRTIWLLTSNKPIHPGSSVKGTHFSWNTCLEIIYFDIVSSKAVRHYDRPVDKTFLAIKVADLALNIKMSCRIKNETKRIKEIGGKGIRRSKSGKVLAMISHSAKRRARSSLNFWILNRIASVPWTLVGEKHESPADRNRMQGQFQYIRRAECRSRNM